MLCVINESELEYTLERGLPPAEAHDWIARPTPASCEMVELSAEDCREMAPAPSGAPRALTLTAAEASRIINIAITTFEPNTMIDGMDGLDLAAIGLIPEELFSQAPTELPGSPHSRELPSSSHPDLKPKATGGLGVMIPAEAHRREALSELNGQLSARALRKRWWSSQWL